MERDADKTHIRFGLFGASGFGREVMPYVKSTLFNLFPQAATTITYVETEPGQDNVNGLPLIPEKLFTATDSTEKYFNIAIANSKTREKITYRMIDCGVEPLTIRAPTAIDLGNNEIGVGAILCSFTHINPNSQIGKFFHCNIYSYVAHDCRIGNFVTFAPNVHCNGNIHIGDHAYIGTGAVLKQGVPDQPLLIGEGAVVGMGAVVTKNVEPYSTVVGNPAKPLVKKNSLMFLTP